MTIYTPTSPDGFELCHPVVQDDFEFVNSYVNGESRAAEWEPLAVKVIREDEGSTLAESDSPWLGSSALIFRPRVLDAMHDMLEGAGELLALACPDAELRMLNVTKVLDALDEDASGLMRFSDGRIMRVLRYVFRSSVVENVDIFKIPNLRVSPTFVSEKFVETWKTNGFKGLDFKNVWES